MVRPANGFPYKMGGSQNFRVVFGLGANVGEPRAQLSRAVAALRAALDRDAVTSSLYRSAPIGPHQPDFLNAAVLIRTALPPLELLDLAHAIEHSEGRVRERHHGPRTLDVDLLWADFSFSHSKLQIPHAELARRAFAWLPCVELVPELGPTSVSFHGQRIEKVAGPDWEHEDPLRKFPS